MDGSTQTEAATFLEALFGAIPDHLHMLLWTMPDKRSYWPKTVQRAVELVDGLIEGHDVYVGAGLSPKAYGPNLRCRMDEIAGIVGLWADIDVAGPNHKKTNLPPTIDAAHELLARMPLRPSIVLATGGGLQAWWLFNEPWVFAGTDERQKAQVLARAWLQVLKRQAEASGWDIDATHDLARVLRVAGTLNQKSTPPQKVTIAASNDARYEPDDFEPFVVNKSEAPPAARVEVGPLVLDHNATPNLKKLMMLFSNEPLAQASFNHHNPSLSDQSASSYDFSIANYLVRAEFTDQEIVNTLIYARKAAGKELKLNADGTIRQDYYQNTISKVRSSIGTVTQSREAREFIKTYAPLPKAAPNNARDEIRKHFSGLIGKQLVRGVRYLVDPPVFELFFEDGKVEVGTAENLRNQNKVASAVAGATKFEMPDFKRAEWKTIVQMLLDICEDEVIGPDGDECGIMHQQLTSYLELNPPGEFNEHAIGGHKPFMREGTICLFGDDFRSFLKRKYQDNLGSKEMGKVFRKLGGKSRVVEVPNLTKRHAAKVWEFVASRFDYEAETPNATTPI